MNYQDYEMLPACEDLSSEQQNTQGYNRQELMTALQKAIDNDSHVLIRLKASELLYEVTQELKYKTTATLLCHNNIKH